jgi:hypothetical protein
MTVQRALRLLLEVFWVSPPLPSRQANILPAVRRALSTQQNWNHDMKFTFKQKLIMHAILSGALIVCIGNFFFEWAIFRGFDGPAMVVMLVIMYVFVCRYLLVGNDELRAHRKRHKKDID